MPIIEERKRLNIPSTDNGEVFEFFSAEQILKDYDLSLEEIKNGTSKYHFIEIMGCPSGCVNGGGQPFVKELFLPNEEVDIAKTYVQKRAQVLYDLDKGKAVRRSHLNKDVQRLYEEFLGKPNSHKAHELLHTHYVAREQFPKK